MLICVSSGSPRLLAGDIPSDGSENRGHPQVEANFNRENDEMNQWMEWLPCFMTFSLPSKTHRLWFGHWKSCRPHRSDPDYGLSVPSTPKWMVCSGKSYQNGWFRGTPILGNLHMKSQSKHTVALSLQLTESIFAPTNSTHQVTQQTTMIDFALLAHKGIKQSRILSFKLHYCEPSRKSNHAFSPLTQKNDQWEKVWNPCHFNLAEVSYGHLRWWFPSIPFKSHLVLHSGFSMIIVTLYVISNY